MEMKTAYPATLQDFVFEGRNKAYGAYMLRKIYPRHIGQALFMAIALFLLLITLPVMVGKLFGNDVPVEDKVVIADLGHTILPPPIIPEAKILPPAEPEAGGGEKVATIKDVTPKVVRDETPVTSPPPSRADVAASTASTVTSPGDGSVSSDNPEVGSGTGSGGGLGTGDTNGTDTGTSSEPFLRVEQMPEFEGGMAKLMDFLGKNIHYPGPAQRNGIEGTVVASFVIMPNGEVADITIIKGLGYGTEEEAMRVLKKMPRWKPGVQNGRKVPVRMTLPIRLELK